MSISAFSSASFPQIGKDAILKAAQACALDHTADPALWGQLEAAIETAFEMLRDKTVADATQICYGVLDVLRMRPAGDPTKADCEEAVGACARFIAGLAPEDSTIRLRRNDNHQYGEGDAPAR